MMSLKQDEIAAFGAVPIVFLYGFNTTVQRNKYSYSNVHLQRVPEVT